MLNTQIKLRQLEHMLSTAPSVEACWPQLTEACREFGFSRIRIYYCGRVLEQELIPSAEDACWRVFIPLPGGGQAELSRRVDLSEDAAMIAPVVGILRQHLPSQLASWQPEIASRQALAATNRD